MKSRMAKLLQSGIHRTMGVEQMLRMTVLMTVALSLAVLIAGCDGKDDDAPEQPPQTALERLQTVQEYFLPMSYYTHIGTDNGLMGPGEEQLVWEPGRVIAGTANQPLREWAGMWHSLAGQAREEHFSLDFTAVYPEWIRAQYQPRVTGIQIRVRGAGPLKVEVKAADDSVLWQRQIRLNAPDEFEEHRFEIDPERAREAKFLNWVAESGAALTVDSIGLVLDSPNLPIHERIFLVSYAKLSRTYSPDRGIVKDRANFPAGDFDNVPTSGLFCLATAAASEMGMVDRQFAEETLVHVHQAVSAIPRALGLLPHFVTGQAITPGTEYSTVDTAIYYHAMLVAAQMLGRDDVTTQLMEAIEEIDFERLQDDEGWIVHGVEDDGQTLMPHVWRDWGGETALVLLLARMAGAPAESLMMEPSGVVFRGVGFIPEIQSLFYPHFSRDIEDALTGINWFQVRRELLQEQIAAAIKYGIYGLSAGESACWEDYVVNGTLEQEDPNLRHPHYMLLSGAIHPDPHDLYSVLETMEGESLFPPWGLVENVHEDCRYLPMLGSLNGSFETIGAYHLHAVSQGQPNRIYEAAENCLPLVEAIRLFYP